MARLLTLQHAHIYIYIFIYGCIYIYAGKLLSVSFLLFGKTTIFRKFYFYTSKKQNESQELYHRRVVFCTTSGVHFCPPKVVQFLTLSVVQFLGFFLALCFPIFGTNCAFCGISKIFLKNQVGTSVVQFQVFSNLGV